jgi:hypothetical protein
VRSHLRYGTERTTSVQQSKHIQIVTNIKKINFFLNKDPHPRPPPRSPPSCGPRSRSQRWRCSGRASRGSSRSSPSATRGCCRWRTGPRRSRAASWTRSASRTQRPRRRRRRRRRVMKRRRLRRPLHLHPPRPPLGPPHAPAQTLHVPPTTTAPAPALTPPRSRCPTAPHCYRGCRRRTGSSARAGTSPKTAARGPRCPSR